ncbi:hypothetical protein G7054_g3541 [Neopestalotiopsis clavispora]|nr:hypothetical protein G7054_g3541 [Neopestalotiopsis clavispora]
MTSDSYTDLRNDLYKDIDEKLEKNNVIVNDNGPAASPWFANYGTAREVFGTSILRRIYRSLAEGITTDSENPELPLKITEETFVSRIQARDLHDVFAVLMYALCQVGAARAMTEKFVTISDDEWQENYYKEPMPGLTASCLPFDQHSLNDIIGEERVSAVQEFHQKQRLFCVVTLEEGKDVVALEPDLYRLPFLKVSQIGTGSYGIVSRIVIAKNYVKFKQGRGHSRNDKPYELARKDYTKSKDFQEEYKVMKSILNSRRSCNTILRSFGSLQVGTNMFSLFMPLALYDLDEWMRKRPPTDLEEKAEVINCMAGIAEGLYFLHTSVSGEHGESLICYHMDLKPNNILVFEREDAPGKFIWKISDFGMSRVKSTKRPTKDLEELFKPTEASLASPTRNRRFQGTYLAPESLLPDGQQMDERSDIWSLGCVIMVVFTYLFMGPSGIKLFSEERGHKSKEWANNDIDTFYLPPKNRLFEEAQPHPIVAKWHEKLMFGHGDPVEAHIVTTMLVYLTNSIVVVDREVRKKADELQRKLEGTYRKYHRLISGQNETIDSTPKAEPSIWKKLGWTKTTK